jgi:hypothetical protein
MRHTFCIFRIRTIQGAGVGIPTEQDKPTEHGQEPQFATGRLRRALDENFRAGVQKRDVVRIRNRTSRPPVRFAALDGQSLERRAITEAECTASSCGRICQQA